MSDLAIEVARSIDDVRSMEWDELCAGAGAGAGPGQSFANHRWLRLAEAILLDHEPRYVLARRDGKLEAAAVCAIVRRFGHSTLQQRLGWALRLFPLLRCAAPLSSRPGFLVSPQPGAAEAIPALLQALRGQALRKRALFVTYGQFAPDDSLWCDLQRTGRMRQHGRLTDFALPISWSSTADYVASLPSPDRRKIGKLERRAEREGIAVTRLTSPLQYATRLRTLIGSVLQHHGSTDIYIKELVERASAILGDDLHVLAAWSAGEIIGCVIALRDGDALVAKWIGLDYARSWGTATYRLLIYHTTRLAIELGVGRLALGPTAAETKLDFGAVGQERLSALAVLAPVPASLVGAAAQLVAGRAAIDPTYSAVGEAPSPALPG